MDDAELRALFHRLRDEEARRSPFRLPRRTRRLRPLFAAAALIVITIAAGIIAFHRHRTPVRESIVTWKAPTDVLLRTPGSELLTTVPRIPDFPERK